MDNSRIIDHILISEGWPLYTNNLSDRGGPTKGGITLQTLSEYRGRTVTAEDVRLLGLAEAREIYERRYILDPHFDDIQDELFRFQVVDAGVLSGQRRASQWLQTAARVTADGKVGPATLAAVNAAEPHFLALKFCALRAKALMKIVSDDHSQAVWAHGWMNRCMEFLELEAERVKMFVDSKWVES